MGELIQVKGDRVAVLQLQAGSEDAARSLLAAARAEGESLHYVQIPAGDVAGGARRRLGGSLGFSQLEMVWSRS